MKRKILALIFVAALVCCVACFAGCSSAASGGSASASGSSAASASGGSTAASSSAQAPKAFYALQNMTVHYTDGTLSSTTYTYENGAITGETVNSGGAIVKASYADYDKNGMPWAETINNQRYDIKYDVNAAGLPLSSTVAGATAKTEYEYYDNNTVKSVTTTAATGNAVIAKMTYGEDGFVATVQNSFGDVSAYAYTKGSDGKVTKLAINTTMVDGSKISNEYAVTTDEAGNIVALTNADGFKVYEAHYGKMDNPTPYVKAIYGSPLYYWG